MGSGAYLGPDGIDPERAGTSYTYRARLMPCFFIIV